MKIIIQLVRIIVGILFIFSGLIKANDPLGLSYKMQEFFELWGMTQFNNLTLSLSVIMIAFEIIAGVALLLGWRMRLFIWLLLVLIVFFTFLTGYAYLSGKFKSCGCFGDCIPITPFTSFMKDVILTVLILLLFIKRQYLKPVLSSRIAGILMLLTMIFSFGIQWYTLKYLPVFDCLPFKVGNSIPENMKMPADAIPDSTIITFVYQKDGENIEFTADSFPEDYDEERYTFVKRYDKVIRPGKNNMPPINGFALFGISGSDSTNIALTDEYAVMVIADKMILSPEKWQKELKEVNDAAAAKNIPLYFVTGRVEQAIAFLTESGLGHLPVFTCDMKAMNTAARVEPTYFVLKKGVVVKKESYARIAKVQDFLSTLPVLPPVAVPADTIPVQTVPSE